VDYPPYEPGRRPGEGSYPRHATGHGYQAGGGQPAYFGDTRTDLYAGDWPGPGYQPGAPGRRRAPLPPGPPACPGPDGTRRWRALLREEWPLAVFCACVAAIALLYNLFGAPDVLYDEAAYVFMAKQVALQGQLTLTNQPMFIHPPLMWLLEAGWLRLTGYAWAPEPSAIYAARLLSAPVGAIAAILVGAMAYRLAENATSRQRRLITGAVTLLVALDPALVRYDRQAVIEPFAVCMGMVVMHAAWSLRARGTFAYVSIVGLLGGITLLTNEIAVFLVIVPVIFALLERDRSLIRKSVAAFGIALAFALIDFFWAVELGLGGEYIWVQTNGFQRLIGLIQSTGFNMPGVSLVGSLMESVKQYSSSYIMLGSGFAAFIWCCSRKNTQTARFLFAWLIASYALAAYIAAVGTLNVNFFCYPLPGCIVGSVFLADAVIARWINYRARQRPRNLGGKELARTRRLPFAVGAVAGAGLVALSAASWVSNYSKPGDGVAQADRYIAANLPGCAMVNASGDSAKYSYLLGGRYFTYFGVGPDAIANGIHYFLLAPTDAIERSPDMTPELESWIEANGQRLATFPSATYRTVQLWYVPSSPYDPTADLTDINGGVYVNTVSSDCAGYNVMNGKTGAFYSAYTALGGKGVVGKPVSKVTGSASAGYDQVFDGVVLTRQPGSAAGVAALPVVATLAKESPSAYRKAGLPPVLSNITPTAARGLLTNPVITSFYLGGGTSPARYTAAVKRYGQPLGLPSRLPGGGFAQAFANVVLEVPSNGKNVHAATIAPALLAVGVLHLPAGATAPQSPPPLPLGQYGRYSVFPGTLSAYQPAPLKPFVETLVAALAGYGFLVALVEMWRTRRTRVPDSWHGQRDDGRGDDGR